MRVREREAFGEFPLDKLGRDYDTSETGSASHYNGSPTQAKSAQPRCTCPRTKLALSVARIFHSRRISDYLS